MKKGNVVSGKQANHGDYCLPQEIAYLGAPALYLAVAHWAILRGGAVTREDISRAFKISPAQATGVLNYIHRDKKETILSRKVIKKVRSGHRQLHLRIIDLLPSWDKCA
ncbi:CaiF/GrlA family transcriptional regulator [Serratia sp. OS31]|uniref:CaiF/GrlA family transcriptional regulator n=1 Tax=Serratia sp. OS31 TaxID=2760844 RepID=UPI0016026A69|nr:CaiF/GrlA family transcriptional regulator [Serratia sp. OS31]MBB1584999.1 CaiF/GrlA family transcriptional regulator [Serratia sp. OS31]